MSNNMKMFKISKRIVIALAVIALIFPVSAAAQDTDLLFEEGNRFYLQEEYENALTSYFAILGQGINSGELYYNMGNSYYKLGSMGKAILYYERARLLIPDDGDLLNNIGLANININDRITPLPKVFYVEYWDSFRKSLSPAAWKAVFLVWWSICSLLVILLFFIRKNGARKILRINLIGAMLLLIISGSALISSTILDKPGSTGVVMEEEVRAFASPTETGTEVFVIHEGTIISVKRVMESWIEIRLADGKVGWIPEETIEII